MPDPVRNLIIVLGDQLNADSAAFDEFDPKQDAVFMAEVADEARHVRSHKARIVMFLAAMRHFRDELRQRGLTVDYQPLDGADAALSLIAALHAAVARRKPERLVMVEAGEYRVEHALRTAAGKLGLELSIKPDRTFFCSRDQFADHAAGRKQLRMEYFYRAMRKTHDVLMDRGKPVGGEWNFDKANRDSFGSDGPPLRAERRSFKPDKLTRQVIALVNARFEDHPGSTDAFDWPVTRKQARVALRDFIQHRLPHFGDFQDAMWADQPFLYHAQLSAAINLKLLDPREAVDAAVEAYEAGHAPLNAVEGFVRQLLGWREYVRGVYWLYMPEYLQRNALDAHGDLPAFYWTGQTDMNCLRHCIGQTLELGYAHHIQRLMVTGLFAMLLGVDPQAVHEWYLAVYVEAVEWVELPNTLGMSQYADGGVMASKPYAATGKYINRMSNYCRGCRYDPAKSTGDDACPFTTLYWDFLMGHEAALADNPRMALQVRNLERLDEGEKRRIGRRADRIRTEFCPG